MSDTLTVRAPCPHGRYEAHTEGPGKDPFWGCTGYREIRLRREVVGPDSFMNADEIWWVEVDDDE